MYFIVLYVTITYCVQVISIGFNMSFFNQFIWNEDDLCLIMNNDFIEHVDKLKEITAKLESKELFSLKINSYEAIKMFNETWFSQQFDCDIFFVWWWKNALIYGFIDYLNNLKIIEYKGKKVLVMTGFKPCKDSNNNFVIKPPNVINCKAFYKFLKLQKNIINIY